MSYEFEEIERRILALEKRAQEIYFSNGNQVPISEEAFYFLGVVDKSIKLIDGFLYALKN